MLKILKNVKDFNKIKKMLEIFENFDDVNSIGKVKDF
jgi:hypothetical protein